MGGGGGPSKLESRGEVGQKNWNREAWGGGVYGGSNLPSGEGGL